MWVAVIVLRTPTRGAAPDLRPPFLPRPPAAESGTRRSAATVALGRPASLRGGGRGGKGAEVGDKRGGAAVWGDAAARAERGPGLLL
jgi:hypothetical protein